jgi:hypothetical protein
MNNFVVPRSRLAALFILATMALHRWRRRHEDTARYVTPEPVRRQLDHPAG